MLKSAGRVVIPLSESSLGRAGKRGDASRDRGEWPTEETFS